MSDATAEVLMFDFAFTLRLNQTSPANKPSTISKLDATVIAVDVIPEVSSAAEVSRLSLVRGGKVGKSTAVFPLLPSEVASRFVIAWPLVLPLGRMIVAVGFCSFASWACVFWLSPKGVTDSAAVSKSVTLTKWFIRVPGVSAVNGISFS